MKMLMGLLALVGVALLLRSTALSVLAARGVVLDVLAFVTVLWALRHGETWGTTFGFVLGLAADLDAAHWMGRHALVLALIGYAVGRLSHTLVRDSARTQLVLLALATLIHETWVLSFELGGLTAWPYLLGRIVLATIATAPIGTLILTITRWGTGGPLLGHADVQPGPTH